MVKSFLSFNFHTSDEMFDNSDDNIIRLRLWCSSLKEKTMRTKFITLALVIGMTGNVVSQQNSMVVVIKNINEATGQIAVALFDNEKDFTKKMLHGKTTVSKAGEVQVVFENVVLGDYAISVMHDANENGEIDSNAFGIPKEGFGFSNDAMGMFGPPSFEKAKFNFTGKSQVVITLKYM